MSDANVTENVRAGLSRNESLLLSILSEKNKTIFTLKDAVTNLKCPYTYAKTLTSNLKKKKWITPLKRGTYLIAPLSAGAKAHYTEHEYIIAAHLTSPYYIAYWSALNYHGYTEQTPYSVFIATTKRAKNREVLNTKFVFVTLNKRKFFGYKPVQIGTYRINISDREKTIADALDHPEYCGGIGEVAKCLLNSWENLSVKKVIKYSEIMKNTAIVKRLGYLAEKLELNIQTEVLDRMKAAISCGMSTLDSALPKTGFYSTRWNLLVNTSIENLEEREA